jgi:predicted lactoylglutathione lyase
MKQIFINLPVKNIEASMQFYQAIGFTVNPVFTDADQKCMVLSDAIFIMLQTTTMFTTHIKKPIPDLKNNIGASYTLPVESIDKVNTLMISGINAGGVEIIAPIESGFMLVRTLVDLDGHVWGIIHLDMNKFKPLNQ